MLHARWLLRHPALQTRQKHPSRRIVANIQNVILMLKALGETVILGPVHAGRLVWQINSRLIDLPGDFAHGVQRSAHLIQRLRLIAQTETAPACDPPKSDKEDAATAIAPRTDNPNPASAEPCRCLL